MVEVLAFLVLVLLQILDTYSTDYGFRHNLVKELNPFLNKMFDKIGVLPSLLLIKIPIMTSIYFYGMSLTVLIPLIALYGYVVWNNFKVIGKR